MPEMDGLQMSKIITRFLNEQVNQALKPASSLGEIIDLSIFETKIYAVTAMNEEHISKNYKQCGIEAVFSKPLRTDALRPVISELFPMVQQHYID
jgi:CheY-like chemotaxis protein